VSSDRANAGSDFEQVFFDQSTRVPDRASANVKIPAEFFLGAPLRTQFHDLALPRAIVFRVSCQADRFIRLRA
jgi:hypothetical protein